MRHLIARTFARLIRPKLKPLAKTRARQKAALATVRKNKDR